MSDIMQAIPAGSPIMKAWTAYKRTDEYANICKWATTLDHVDGAIWAAFSSGFLSASLLQAQTAADELEAAAHAEGRAAGLREAAGIAYQTPFYTGLSRDKDGLLQPGSPYDRGRYDARNVILARAAEVEGKEKNP